LADPFEPLNSSLAQWAEELGHWQGNQKLLFFCENRRNQAALKVLKGTPEKGLLKMLGAIF